MSVYLIKIIELGENLTYVSSKTVEGAKTIAPAMNLAAELVRTFVATEAGREAGEAMKVIDLHDLKQVNEPKLDSILVYRLESNPQIWYIYRKRTDVVKTPGAIWGATEKYVSTFRMTHIFEVEETDKIQSLLEAKAMDKHANSQTDNTPALVTGAERLRQLRRAEAPANKMYVELIGKIASKYQGVIPPAPPAKPLLKSQLGQSRIEDVAPVDKPVKVDVPVISQVEVDASVETPIEVPVNSPVDSPVTSQVETPTEQLLAGQALVQKISVQNISPLEASVKLVPEPNFDPKATTNLDPHVANNSVPLTDSLLRQMEITPEPVTFIEFTAQKIRDYIGNATATDQVDTLFHAKKSEVD